MGLQGRVAFVVFLLVLLCKGQVSNGKKVEQELVISSGLVSPDGGPERLAILTNGEFGGPVITVNAGDVLKVDIRNQMEKGYDGFNATSIHYHGFSMRGVPYFDGVGFVSQCPLYPGNDMTAEFVVKEIPGTYMWHGHTHTLIADGLSGGLIVLPETSNTGDRAEDDHVIVLSDFFNDSAPVLSAGLNGVEVPVMGSEEYATFSWVGTPRSLLMNFKGCYADCNARVKGIVEVCTPDPECESRYVLNVKPKTTVRIRFIGAGSLVYQTICFEGHNITLIEEDARAVEPLPLGECVDVNLGQRMDILLTTKDERELNQTSFWISGRGGKSGTPASYGVLQYITGSEQTAGGVSLPPSAPPQPIDTPIKWSNSGFSKNIVSPKSRNLPTYITDGTLPNKRAVVEISEPIMQQTGQDRIALSNVVYLATPSCNNALELAANGEWLSQESNPYLIDSAEDVERINITDIPGLGEESGSGDSYVLLNLAFNTSLMPQQPIAGRQVLELNSNDVVDVLIQNNKDDSFGGLDAPGPGLLEFEHPIHLHGQHFFVLGQGKGNFLSLEKEKPLDTLLNFENPPEVDTFTLPSNGWLYLRFRASNPGVWPMHCHIAWHEWMGQLLLFAEDVENIPSIPSGILPECPASCEYNAAPVPSTTMSKGNGSTTSSPPSNASLGRMNLGPLLLVLIFFWIVQRRD